MVKYRSSWATVCISSLSLNLHPLCYVCSLCVNTECCCCFRGHIFIQLFILFCFFSRHPASSNKGNTRRLRFCTKRFWLVLMRKSLDLLMVRPHSGCWSLQWIAEVRFFGDSLFLFTLNQWINTKLSQGKLWLVTLNCTWKYTLLFLFCFHLLFTLESATDTRLNSGPCFN